MMKPNRELRFDSYIYKVKNHIPVRNESAEYGSFSYGENSI